MHTVDTKYQISSHSQHQMKIKQFFFSFSISILISTADLENMKQHELKRIEIMKCFYTQNSYDCMSSFFRFINKIRCVCMPNLYVC